MRARNSVQLIGYLCSRAKLLYFSDYTATCTITVRTIEPFVDSAGNRKDVVERHRVVFYGKIAEAVDLCLDEGSYVLIGGRLRTRRWADAQGSTHYTTEVVCKELVMLDRKKGGDTFPDTLVEDTDLSDDLGAPVVKEKA